MRRLISLILILLMLIPCIALAEENQLLKTETLVGRDESVIQRAASFPASEKETPLLVKGYGFAPEMIPLFMSDHAEIPLVIDNEFFFDRDQFIAAIQSRDSQVDIYVLPDSLNVWKLIDKGYALELNSFQKLNSILQTMNSTVVKAVFHEEAVCAVPISLFLNAWMVRPDLLEEAGYGHVPSTMQEYFEMLKEWEEDKSEDFDFCFSFTFFSDFGLKLYPCVQMAALEYITQYETPERPLSFDTAVFRQVLTAIENLGYPYENVDEAIAAVTDYSNFTRNPKTIFHISDSNLQNVGQIQEHSETLIPPPPYEKNREKRALASTYLAVVNPYSRHVDDAIIFLTFAVSHCAYDSKIALFPDENEALPNEAALKQIEEGQLVLEKMKAILKDADKEHEAEIKEEITRWEAFIEDQRLRQDAVTVEAIKAYRELEPYIYLPRDSVFLNASAEIKNELFDILKRYAAGAIDGDGMIRELDQKFSLMFMER